MAYIIAAIFIVFCTIALVFAIRVYRENRKIASNKKDTFDDDEIKFRP